MVVPKIRRTLDLDTASQPGRPAHISAASGLARAGESLIVLADDENHLGVFPCEGNGAGKLVQMAEGTLPLKPKPRKRRKPDFESIVCLPPFAGYPYGALLALGSCSRPNRCRGFVIGFDAKGALEGRPTLLDLTGLREALESRFGTLNVEGAVVLGEELVLLQRGNKGDKRNARIRLRWNFVAAAIRGDLEAGCRALIDIHEHDLGETCGVPYGFTDGAALPDGGMVFTAVAENTDDSYSDGGCVGSAVGMLDTIGRVTFFAPIEGKPKVEGVDAAIEGDRMRLLLVTDADDSKVPGLLLGTSLQLAS
jgi:hypothetical protein